MNNLSELEIKNKMVKYLNKKDINIVLDESNNLRWIYTPYYSNFKISIYPEKKDYNNEEECYTIKYYSNYKIDGIRRRRTLVNGNFCLAVYKNLIFIKNQLDKFAEEVRNETETKIKYCTELESYYKKLHQKVVISSINKQASGVVNIAFNCHDEDNYTYYSIIFKDGKYYLIYKVQHLKEEILNYE